MTIWQVFFPCIFGRKPEPPTEPIGLKGLAMATVRLADLDLLDVKWWYVWGWGSFTDERYVPMVRDWSCPAKPAPEYLLVGNEPNAIEPYGHTMSPEYAVQFLHTLELAYPDTTMVVGNVSADNWGMGGDGVWWLTRFLQYYLEANGRPFSHILGCHEYAYSANLAITQFKRYRAIYSGRMWLTECNLVQTPIDTAQFREMFQAAGDTFERYACYTNQQDGGGSSLPYPMDLCTDGILTPIGEAYALLG